MAGPKRTRLEREHALAEVAKLERRGYTVREMGEALGVSHVQCVYDLRVIRRRYAETQMAEHNESVNATLGRLMDIYREALDAYDWSKGKCSKEIVQAVLTALQERGREPSSSLLTKIKNLKLRYAPRAEFLRTALDAVAQMRDVLGTDAPKELRGTITGGLDWDSLVKQIDPKELEDKIQKELNDIAKGPGAESQAAEQGEVIDQPTRAIDGPSAKAKAIPYRPGSNGNSNGESR
jgi:hypothetical protein